MSFRSKFIGLAVLMIVGYSGSTGLGQYGESGTAVDPNVPRPSSSPQPKQPPRIRHLNRRIHPIRPGAGVVDLSTESGGPREATRRRFCGEPRTPFTLQKQMMKQLPRRKN